MYSFMGYIIISCIYTTKIGVQTTGFCVADNRKQSCMTYTIELAAFMESTMYVKYDV